jgi:hypothetical protein
MAEDYKDPDWLREHYWAKEMSGREVAAEAGVSWPTISHWMDEHDIPRRDRIQQNEVDLSEEAKRFIHGHILADGSVTNYHKGSALFHFSNKHRGVVEWVRERLESYGFEIQSVGVQEREGGFGTAVYHLRTLAYPSLGDIREQWYVDGRKVVPESFSISPTALLQWYIGDGSRHDGGGITLYTDWYGEGELEHLTSELESVGLEVTKHERGDSNKSLYVPKGSMGRFFEYVGDKPDFDAYDYKWP